MSKDNVFEFDVTVDDVLRVDIMKSLGNLSNNQRGRFF